MFRTVRKWPLSTSLGKPDIKAVWNTKKPSLPGCGTKPQVATQKAEIERLVDTCIHHTVAAQTIHEPTTVHPQPHQ